MTKEEMEHEDEIKIKDKRRFTSEGESRTPDENTGEEQAEAENQAKVKAEVEEEQVETEEKSKAEASEDAAQGRELPPLNFANFILSLATSAQMHLGAIPNPQTGKLETNLMMAKETIDLLDLLKEKTKGNVTPDEERLFDHMLYDLRMMYVDKNKQGEKGQQG